MGGEVASKGGERERSGRALSFSVVWRSFKASATTENALSPSSHYPLCPAPPPPASVVVYTLCRRLERELCCVLLFSLCYYYLFFAHVSQRGWTSTGREKKIVSLSVSVSILLLDLFPWRRIGSLSFGFSCRSEAHQNRDRPLAPRPSTRFRRREKERINFLQALLMIFLLHLSLDLGRT